MRLLWIVAPAAAAVVVAACSSDDPDGEPPCVAGLTADCAAAYDPPTYDALFTNVLRPTCASGVGTCHTADARQGGLVFEDPDRAYAALLGTEGAHARVRPGDPACSLLMKRLASSDPSYRMPRGPEPLSPSEICTFTKWIAQGAAR